MELATSEHPPSSRLSRGRQLTLTRIEARIYTDDIGKLPEAIRLDTVKHAAMDLVRAGHERQVVRAEAVRAGPERQRDEGFER